MKKKVISAFALTFLVLIFGVALGSVYIQPTEIFNIFLNEFCGFSKEIDEINKILILNIRLPRVCIVFFIGAGLALSGAVIQSVLQNPLASAYGLGISSGAGLGVTLLIITGFTSGILGALLMPIVALVFGIVSVLLTIYVAQKIDKNLANNSIILTGMVFSLFINSIMTSLCSVFPQHSPKIILWQSGNFSLKEWWIIITFACILSISFVFLYKFHLEMDIMSLGSNQAMSVGVNTQKITWFLIIVTAILTSSAVAFVGIIGFVDLISPHIVRKFFDSQHKYVLPMTMLFGGSFMVLCDIISRTIASPSVIPIGSVTAIIGAPFFVMVFLKNRSIHD
ncbi:MAG: iron ABC transporter permease [Clostridia bacterium]